MNHLFICDQPSGLAQLFGSQQKFRELGWAEGRSLGIISEGIRVPILKQGLSRRDLSPHGMLPREVSEHIVRPKMSPRWNCQLAPRNGGTGIFLSAH